MVDTCHIWVCTRGKSLSNAAYVTWHFLIIIVLYNTLGFTLERNHISAYYVTEHLRIIIVLHATGWVTLERNRISVSYVIQYFRIIVIHVTLFFGNSRASQNLRNLRKIYFAHKIILELHLSVRCVFSVINGTFKSIWNYQNVCKHNCFYRIKICKTVWGNVITLQLAGITVAKTKKNFEIRNLQNFVLSVKYY